MRKQLLCLIGLSGVLILTSGCLRRSLTIQSDPPGAAVYFQDEYKGDTPVTFDPVFYGNYRIRLEKEGYERLEAKRLYKAPPYAWIPIDLIVELIPYDVHDEREWSFALEETEPLVVPLPPSEYSK